MNPSSFYLLLSQFLICALLISCENSNSNSQVERNVINIFLTKQINDSNNKLCNGSNGGFWARDLVAASQATFCVRSSLVSSTTNMDLYVQNGLVTNLNYATIANSFETNIFPIEKEAFGAPSDINHDGKITVLILDIKDGATTSSGFVAGFVDPVNFSVDDPQLIVRSNQREIIFMDGVELIKLRDKDLANGKPDIFLSTLAHEFQHLIRYQYSQGEDDTWIDEGTSEVTSDLTGYGPQTARLNCFKGDSSSSSSCSGGIGSTSTGSPSLFNWNSNLKNYAYAYSFMKYVYESSGSSPTIRNNFFQQTVKGINGTRANNAYNLMTIYLNANYYNTSVLGNDNKTAFKKLFASFLGQAVGYTNLNKVYFGNATAVNIDSVRITYPFSSSLSVLSTPTPFASISKLSLFSLNPSQVNRVYGSTTGLTSGSIDLTIVSNGANEFIIFNGDNIGSKTNISYGSAKIDIPAQNPKLDLHTDTEIICPNDFFNQVNKLEKVKFNLKSMLEFAKDEN